MIVVADTSPPLHLGRIGRLDLLPAVVGRVTVPRTVWGELVHAGTRPDVVASLEAASWIDVVDDPVSQDLGLDPGETAAILLAERARADALLTLSAFRFLASSRPPAGWPPYGRCPAARPGEGPQGAVRHPSGRAIRPTMG